MAGDCKQGLRVCGCGWLREGWREGWRETDLVKLDQGLLEAVLKLPDLFLNSLIAPKDEEAMMMEGTGVQGREERGEGWIVGLGRWWSLVGFFRGVRYTGASRPLKNISLGGPQRQCRVAGTAIEKNRERGEEAW